MFTMTNIIFLNLFIWGFYGLIINKNNLIQMMMSLEMMILSLILNLTFMIFNTNYLKGSIIFILLIVIAASETALGLTLVVSLNKISGNMSTFSLNLVK